MKTNKKPASFHTDVTKIRISDTSSFKKSFLKNGWAVKTANGRWFIVTKITGYGTAFLDAETNEVYSARHWDSVLHHKADKKMNIVLVAQPCDMNDYINRTFDNYIVCFCEEKKKKRGRKPSPKTVNDLKKSS